MLMLPDEDIYIMHSLVVGDAGSLQWGKAEKTILSLVQQPHFMASLP
jgi:hypothetical protein